MANNIRKFPSSSGKNDTINKIKYIDIGLIFCVFVLVVIGLIMIYSSSAYYAANTEGRSSDYFLKKQFGAAIAGFIVMVITANIPYLLYKKFAFTGLIIAFVSIVLIFTPLKQTINGATRWIKIMGISIQPAEIVKLMIIIFMAQCLSRRDVNVNNLKGIFFTLVVPGAFAAMVLFFTDNLSSAIIIGFIAFVMIFVKSRNYKIFMISIPIIGLLAFAFVMLAKYEDVNGWNILGYRGDRIRAWLDPVAYAKDEGYQTLQSLYAIGSGGIFGKGIGESTQKLGFIPEAQNDMIFAIICEELGFVGAIFVIIVFIVLISRCRFIALRAKDLFGSMLAIGVMVHISIQAMLNIAVATNSIPNTGISLPFISYGGTSILFLMAEMGIVINVGKSINVE